LKTLTLKVIINKLYELDIQKITFKPKSLNETNFMTSVTASNDQWYNKTWLVILLCLFVFPVGLYALWKSEKIPKGWKIGLTVLFGLLVYAAFSDKGQAKETPQEPGPSSAATTPATAQTAMTVDTTAATPAPASATAALFDSPESFKTIFNKYTSSHDLEDLQIDDIEVKHGEVQNTFQYMFTEHLGVIGTVNKSDGSVKEITLIGTGDGTIKSGSNIILGIVAVIATVDPSLTPDGRMGILKKLKIMGDDDADLSDLSTKTRHNGIKYFVSSSKAMGLWFGASRE
jgi:hypothetical protein